MAFDLSGYLSQFAGGGPGGMWSNFQDMGGLDLSQLFGQQQGYIQGMGPNFGQTPNIINQLMGGQFGQGMNPFISQLQGFRPELSGDVRSTMAGIMEDPWGGTARGTLDEMLTTGAPVDVSGIGDAAAIRGNRWLEQATGQARERAAAGGGLAGSGFQNQMADIGGQITDQMLARVLEGEVGAAERAQGRRMGALGLNLQGQGLAAGTAGRLGGLENQLSGQQLQALLGGGQLAGQQGQMNLQGLQSAGGLQQAMSALGLQGQMAQAGAGQDFLNMLPGFAQSGAFAGQRDPLGPEALAHYIQDIGNMENQVLRGNPYFQLMKYMSNPTSPSSPAAQAGGGGGNFMDSLMQNLGGGGGVPSGGGGGSPSFQPGGYGIPPQPVTPGAAEGETFGWVAPPGVIPPGPDMSQPMGPHPASQPAAGPTAPGPSAPVAPSAPAPGPTGPAAPSGPAVAPAAAGPSAPAGAPSVGSMQQNAYARGQTGAAAAGVQVDPATGAYVGNVTGQPMKTAADFEANGWVKLSDVAGTTKSGGRWDPKEMYVSPNVNPEEAKAVYKEYLDAASAAKGQNYYGSPAWVARENAINKMQEMGIMNPAGEMQQQPKQPWEEGYSRPDPTGVGSYGRYSFA